MFALAKGLSAMAAFPDARLARTLPCLNAALRDASLSVVVRHNAPPEVERLRSDLEQARETIDDLRLDIECLEEYLRETTRLIYDREYWQHACDHPYSLQRILICRFHRWWERWKDEIRNPGSQNPWSDP